MAEELMAEELSNVLSVSGKEWPFLHLSGRSQNSLLRHEPYNIETAIIDFTVLTDWLTHWPHDWLTDWQTYLLVDRLID